LVKSHRQALDRIAHDLEMRSSVESFRFLDRVNIPFRKVSEQDIDYTYTLPIPNSQTDIPKSYHEYRDGLRSLSWEMEEALVTIDTIFQTPNPRAALAELEKLQEYRGGSSFRDGLTFTGYKSDLDWSYLPEALDEHENRTKALEQAGRLTAYVDLSHTVKEQISRRAKRLEPDAKERQYLWAGLYYDPATLAFDKVSVRLIEEKTRKSKAALTKSIYLHPGETPKLDEPASYLWHVLMTNVLEAICPGVTDDD